MLSAWVPSTCCVSQACSKRGHVRRARDHSGRRLRNSARGDCGLYRSTRMRLEHRARERPRCRCSDRAGADAFDGSAASSAAGSAAAAR
jgi:hypothetical protein